MTVLEKILDEIEDYGKYKGVLGLVEDSGDNWVPVREIKKIILSHMNDGWISVEEKMPEYCDYIIPCFVELKRRDSKHSFITRIQWHNNSWRWSNGKKLSDKYQVLAWQKIEYPVPYQSEELNERIKNNCSR